MTRSVRLPLNRTRQGCSEIVLHTPPGVATFQKMPGFKGPRLPGWCTLPRWQGKGGLVETAKIEPQKGPSLVGSCIDLGAFGVSARHQVAMLLGKRPPWDGVREKSGRTLLVLVRVLWTW